MNSLDAPFLEVAFYFTELSDADAFGAVARAILARGARFVHAEGRRGPRERSRSFARPDEPLPVPLDLRLDQLAAALADPDLRILELQFDQIIGISKAPERLEYESISEDAAATDHHPIVILAEGESFSGSAQANEGRDPGKRTYEAFRELVLRLAPSYACITIEAATKCPTDLRRNPSNRAFTDFFMSGSFLGANGLATIAKWFDGAYQEQIGDGLYISTYRHWNPRRVTMDRSKADYLAIDVGKLVARHHQVRA